MWETECPEAFSVRRFAGEDHARTARPDACRPDTEILLSGLLTCGAFGGGYAIIGRDRYDCATRRCKGTCDNGVTIGRQRIEARVLHGFKDHMLAPDLVAEFVRAFAEQMAAAQCDAVDAGAG